MGFSTLILNCLQLAISVLSLFNSCLICAATNISSSDQQVSIKQQQEGDCPLWFYRDNYTHFCECFHYYAAHCFHNKAYLSAGHCATYDEENDTVSMSVCPYHGFAFTRQGIDWYVELPENISTLNDYMCGPLNRKGRICSECKEGYGQSVTSVGFHYFECSKCTDVWYGIPLYLLLELLPLTIFYLTILLLQVNITSAPMTSYIMFSQVVVMGLDHVFSGDEPDVEDMTILLDRHSKLLFAFISSVNDVWNLRFFRYLLPALCVSKRLNPIHLSLLEYISVFYPLCLIILTWMCVQLHDHGFRPLVCLWHTLHRYIFWWRREREREIDFINVFASFFLLSFTKVMYQTALLMISRKFRMFRYDHGTLHFLEDTLVVGADESVFYGSTEHLVFLIPSLLLCIIFVVLPTLLLLLYPFHFFQSLLTMCHLNGNALKFFVEKFYSCYRDGLPRNCDGGRERDMRSFAALYFVLRVGLFCSPFYGGLIKVADNDSFLWKSMVFVVALLLIALCRPYKKMYMNVLDILLLAYLVFLCQLISAEQAFSLQESVPYTVDILLAFPFICFMLFFVAMGVKKVCRVQYLYGLIHQTCSSHYSRLISRLTIQGNDSRMETSFGERQRRDAVIEVTYGSVNA